MARAYQPSLLRLLHGGMAAVVVLCWFTGVGLYSQFDGRWGRLSLRIPDVIDLHGSLGVALVLISCLFVPYAFTLGRWRLAQFSNAVALGALLLAVGSGLLMDEDWPRRGELHHWAYSLHLSAWLVLTLAVLFHLLGLWRRGGWALLGSMLSLGLRAGDAPAQWPDQLRRFFGFP
jgi:hypothetical protein